MKLHSLTNVPSSMGIKCFGCNEEPAIWRCHITEGVVEINLCLGSLCTALAMAGTLDLSKWAKRKGEGNE